MKNQDLLAPIPSTAVNPVGGAVMNAIFNIFKNKTKPVKKPVEPDFENGLDPAVFGEDLIKGFNIYNKQFKVADSALTSRNKEYKLDNPVAILSQGKFQGVKLSKEMINDAINASKKAKINPLDLLAIMGQESTFSQSNVRGQFRYPDQKSMTSGRNTAEGYEPYKLERFLADKGVPGISKIKRYGDMSYSINDLDAVKSALKKRPGLMQQYINKVQATPIAEENFLDMAAKFIQKKGIKGYNPGDPNYVKDVMNSKVLLQKDPQLMKYLKSKGI
jgi:hypothetical protein